MAVLLKYLPANRSWAFIYGDAIVQLGDAPRLFLRLSDAIKQAEKHGLTVKGGRVEAAN